MAKRFSELTKGYSPERRARIEAKKTQLRREMDLAELRKALAFTQSALAESLGVGQAEVSKIEQRTDVFVSTLRRFVQAMGGDLEVNAVFPGHKVTITNFTGLAEEANQGPGETSNARSNEVRPAR